MLGVIVNEMDVVNKIINSKNCNSDIGKYFYLMVKYYYISEKITDRQELKEKIFSLLNKKYEGYKRGKWEAIVDRNVNSFLKSVKYKKEDRTKDKFKEFYPNKEFFEISKIYITDIELKAISNLNDKNLEKTAFIMLVYAKISNEILKENVNWATQSISNILKEAKINLKGNEKELLLHKLYNMKLYEIESVDIETGEILMETVNYISMSKSNSKNSFKINYLESINENSKIEIIIEDFESVIYYYLLWKGEKWKQCTHLNQEKKCKRWFKLKTPNSNQKYCAICSKEENIKKTIENRKKFET